MVIMASLQDTGRVEGIVRNKTFYDPYLETENAGGSSHMISLACSVPRTISLSREPQSDMPVL
jgi:hypothetical protein